MAVRYPVIPELYIVSALQRLLEKKAKKWEPQSKITVLFCVIREVDFLIPHLLSVRCSFAWHHTNDFHKCVYVFIKVEENNASYFCICPNAHLICLRLKWVIWCRKIRHSPEMHQRPSGLELVCHSKHIQTKGQHILEM